MQRFIATLTAKNRAVYSKGNTNYNKRLNDPTLGYTDPW